MINGGGERLESCDPSFFLRCGEGRWDKEAWSI